MRYGSRSGNRMSFSFQEKPPKFTEQGTPRPVVGVTLVLPWPASNLKASQPRLWPAQEFEPPRRHPRRQRKPEARSSQVPTRNKRS